MISFFSKFVVVLSALLLAACTSISRESGNGPATDKVEPMPEAWWLEQEFEPAQEEVAGLDLAQFDSNWRRAAALDETVLQDHLSARQFAEQQRSDQDLSLSLDLNGNALPERFLVGVYEARDGETGRFLALVERDEVIKVFQHPGRAAYSGLLAKENAVHWYKCMRCDNFDTIVWNGSEYTLEYRQHTEVPIP